MQRNEFYPIEWAQISKDIREACGWRCLACDKQCRRPGEMWLGWEYTLTLAHISQEYDTPVITVAALCLPCHFNMDRHYSWWSRRRHAYIRQRIAGQLGLLLDAKVIA